MNTKSETVRYSMLYEAVSSAPKQHLANWLLVVAADFLTAEQLERLGNDLGRVGHMKARDEAAA